jgi:hypothetical protein
LIIIIIVIIIAVLIIARSFQTRRSQPDVAEAIIRVSLLHVFLYHHAPSSSVGFQQKASMSLDLVRRVAMLFAKGALHVNRRELEASGNNISCQ